MSHDKHTSPGGAASAGPLSDVGAGRYEGPQLASVVLEDYFQVAPLRSVVRTAQWQRFETRVEANTLKALDLLDEFRVKATFFVLGWIADEMPEVIREVTRRGHEVASKGYEHRSIREYSPDSFREDVARSREAIERACGTRVHGYRIAHGWFGPDDLWALDVLADEGYNYDSSVRPIYWRFSGERHRRIVHLYRHDQGGLWEIPLSTWSLGGWSFPISGGNYFRQLPHWLMTRAVESWVRRADSPFVLYFHVWEFDPDQPRIRAAPLLERVRQYRNLDRMENIIRHYLERYRFVPIGDWLGLPRAAEPATRTVRSAQPGSVTAPLPATAESPAPIRKQAVTVVVPCFNEELILPYLARTLDSVEAVLGQRYAFQFIFVDDGSTDGTWSSLEATFQHRANCRLLRHQRNRGVAEAILTGIRNARTKIVCSIDCDCTYDPHQLGKLIPMLEPGVDMVTASPYHPAGQVRNVPSWRLALSRGLSGLYRIVLRQRLATYTSCFRVYRRRSFLDLRVREAGFLGVAEMIGILTLRKGRIVECPAVLESRLFGASKMKVVKTIVGHLGLLIRLAVRRATGAGDVAASSDRIRSVGQSNNDSRGIQ